ncbi:hypothetical protein P7M11_07360 [Bisgaard Taxon 10/6]|uniref:hypothetical protein n=1 Tax=Exercitatus varius TaxID=67857 RepID=UPI00294B82FD|nr:hypothetical protein [Exercitatus varius]MDG2954540.1 hypothetical protein [Exercitatus varius]
MDKKIIHTALAVLMSLGAAACSSGGSEKPGVSQEEYKAQQAEAELLQAESNAKIKSESSISYSEQAKVLAIKARDYIAKALAATDSAEATKYADLAAQAIAEANSAIKNAEEGAKDSAKAAVLVNSSATNSYTSAAAAALQEAKDETTHLSTLNNTVSNHVTKLKEQETDAIELTNFRVSTTNYSYKRSDSVVHNYADVAKRDTLLAEIKNNENLIAGGTSCAAGTPGNPGACFGGGKLGKAAGSREGEIVPGKAKGTVLGSYAQAYSGYAVIREAYDGNADSNVGDANAYLALVDSNNLVKDKKLVTDATYMGTASYTLNGNTAVRTDLLTMNVKDDAISGNVYRTTTNGKGVTSTNTYVQFRTAGISVDDVSGVVGFNGKAFIDTSAKSVVGTSPKTTSDAANGTYQGVFAGPNAKEVVGTFETNSNIEKSVRGAFAASK